MSLVFLGPWDRLNCHAATGWFGRGWQPGEARLQAGAGAQGPWRIRQGVMVATVMVVASLPKIDGV